MNIREEIGQPGFLIGLIVSLFTIPAMVCVLVLWIGGPGDVIHHRWHDVSANAACSLIACLLVFGGKYLWKRYKSKRASTPA